MAVIAPSYDTKRVNLRNVIPLPSPFTLQIEPTRMCNFRCFFCMHHSRGTQQDLLKASGLDLVHMDMGLYDKIVDDIMAFPVPPKMINFCGIGEPLMNPQFGEMIRRMRKAGYTGRVITYTNGALLNPTLSEELVDSGLSEIRISLNGLSDEQFDRVTGAKVNMERYLDNIRFLYEHKRNMKIYVKIIENLFDKPEDQNKFYQMFDPIADVIYVEHIIQLQRQMKDYNGLTEGNCRNVFNEPIIKDWKTCACMFYQMHVDAEGYVYFCVSLGNPHKFAIGNVKDQRLTEIWNGETRFNALRTNLRQGSDAIPMCVECEGKYDIVADEEYLDDARDMLLERLSGPADSEPSAKG